MTQQYLLRDQAPLSAEQWGQLDHVVTTAARQQLVGRRLLPVFGPVGAGTMAVPIRRVSDVRDAKIDLTGRKEALGTVEDEAFVSIPMIYRDFEIHWRDIEWSQQLGVPLDFSPASAAAKAVARREDQLIFHGYPELGHQGLLNVPDHFVVPLGDWNQAGAAFSNVVSAVLKLSSMGFVGPYAVVVSPGLYSMTNRVFDNTGVLEIDQIRNLAQAGFFLSSVLPEPMAVVVSVGGENLDLVVSQDMVSAFLQVENLNYYFRVFEMIALRIKRPDSIVTLQLPGYQFNTRP